jgi:hypothetical protein
MAAPSSDETANADVKQGVGIQSKEPASTSEDVPGGAHYNPAPHPSKLAADKGTDYLMMRPIYTKEYVESIKPSHRPPKGVRPSPAP